MRVAHLLSSLNPGGAATFVDGLTRRLAERGVDSELIVTWDVDGASRLARRGLPTHRCPHRWSIEVPGAYRLGRRLRDSARWSFALRLARLLRRRRPDLLHSHLHGELWTSQLLAARLAGIPFLLQLHSPSSPYPASWAGRRLFPLLLRPCDRLVAVSEDSYRAYAGYLDRFREQAVVIPNGLPDPGARDATARAEIRGALGVPEDTPLVGGLGRLIAMKRYDVLLDAAERLLAEERSFHLLLVGDGSARPELQARAATDRLAGRVHFAGFQEEPHRWLSAMDLFVLPSEFEGMPVALLEAMAAGLPVVATAVSGSREVVGDEVTGFLVPVGDVGALAAPLARLLADAALRRGLGEAGRRAFVERFRIEVCAERYLELYRAMTGA